MTLPSATATTALLTATLYAALCTASPFARCRHCTATGHRHWAPHPRNRRTCRWCRGTALRLRWGVRAYNRIRRLHRNANH